MSKLLSHSTWSEYSDAEWRCIKISVAFFWFAVISAVSISYDRVPYPSGIFSLINGGFLASKYTVQVFTGCAIVLAVLYVLEKWMTATTFLMFLVSLLLFTLEESNGFLNRHYLYTAIFFAQFVAYYRNSPRLKEERIQFAVQIIAGGYVLAGISKLRQSGLGWVTDAPMVSIQILKGYSYTYFNTGDIKQLELGTQQANFVLQHAFLIKCFFAVSLFLELFSWLAVKNKGRAFVYGLLLTGMHLGIRYYMNILIASIFYPMLIFMINPLYWVYRIICWIYTGIKLRLMDNAVA